MDRNVRSTDTEISTLQILSHSDMRSNAHSFFFKIFLKQCIQEGVRYLMRMLQVRNSVKLNDGVVLHDTTTASFLSEGKYKFS